MELILTHEQADFDALGALLGAALMNEHAIALLPRRLNRNARAFINLYGAALPFVNSADLPNEPIESITLVDTQSLVTLRGMTRSTRVQVVDHHALRPDLPDSWLVTLEATGACTTLFVEGLREHNGVLDPLHATLLLLGIYEDTGSLTYPSTTSRDARAAAYLLDQGAMLQTAVGYLNPSLSVEQRQVYDRLLASAESITLHGRTIVIAAASAEEMTDEISSVAHKIRDLLDPAGLFLLVRTAEGLRLVARSTTEHVDVAAIASHFGGGGHSRASSALVRPSAGGLLPFQQPGEEVLDAAKRELLRILPDHVHPSVTVRQMMSRNPLLLAGDTPVEKAARLIQRYGFEGFPVVQNGRVIGLLNRRAVDRAVAHHLNTTAEKLMDSGEVTVGPDDSLERLRDVMVQSGWGQVPVVDETGRVIGIVTRTDLLKNITGSVPVPGRSNFSARLDAALPPMRLALLKAVAAEARRLHMAVYIVGGFVRDLVLEHPGFDFDIVVEGDAIVLARALSERFGGRTVTHGRFGTAKWSIEPLRAQLATALLPGAQSDPAALPASLDLISARTEFYDYPTALPTVERSSIKLDLHRRDFTINTLALRLDGSHYGDLYDYWGGLRDIHRGLVRVLHSLSFVDDPTRQLRAVRFEQRFGFTIEERTRQLMEEGRPLIAKVSGDRLRHELDLAFEEDRPARLLARLDQFGLLAAIHPGLAWQPDLAAPLERVLTEAVDPAWNLPPPPRAALAYLLWLTRLAPEVSAGVANRLHLPSTLIDWVSQANRLWVDLKNLPGLSPSQVAARLDPLALAAVVAVDRLNPDPAVAEVLHRYISHWRNVRTCTNGQDLRTLGVPPGPRYKEILTALRAARLDGRILTDEEERAALLRLLAGDD